MDSIDIIDIKQVLINPKYHWYVVSLNIKKQADQSKSKCHCPCDKIHVHVRTLKGEFYKINIKVKEWFLSNFASQIRWNDVLFE